MAHSGIRYSEIEPGDIIEVRDRVVTVDRIEHPKDVPDARVPSDWPEEAVKNAIVVFGTELQRDKGWRFVLPNNRAWTMQQVRLLAKSADEGHWPRCHKCGASWPCPEFELIVRGRMIADGMEKRLKAETNYPIPCPADPPCPDRFKTERGAQMHLARNRRHRHDPCTT